MARDYECWFSRPLKEQEYNFFKAHAIEDAWRVCGDTEENRDIGDDVVDLDQYSKVVESVKNGTDYWLDCRYGTTIIEDGKEKSEFVYRIHGIWYLLLEPSSFKIFDDVKRYSCNYPILNVRKEKIIHNRKELRRWLGRKYFEFAQEDLAIISDFFNKVDDGILHFL